MKYGAGRLYKMEVFQKFLGLNVKCRYRDAQKALPYPNDVFRRIFRKNRLRL